MGLDADERAVPGDARRRVPSIEPSVSWLRGLDDPVVELFLAIEVDGGQRSSCRPLAEAVVQSEIIRSVFSSQHHDGSWGPVGSNDRSRILATLHTLHTLHTVAIMGAGRHPGAERGVEFLRRTASTDGVFTIDGRRDGVLSCYVATAASTYLLCGADEAADAQIDWLLRHQDVSRAGHRVRAEAPAEWGAYLRTRYGGCMADTTCLVGLAKVGRALRIHAQLSGRRPVGPLQGAIREVFLDRRLMFDRHDRVVPLGVARSRASDWLLPTFPLDWHTDLIEVLQAVGSGPPDVRLQPALDALDAWRLPDGSWPLRRSFWPDAVTVRERKSPTRGNPMVTIRAVRALQACHESTRS